MYIAHPHIHIQPYESIQQVGRTWKFGLVGVTYNDWWCRRQHSKKKEKGNKKPYAHLKTFPQNFSIRNFFLEWKTNFRTCRPWWIVQPLNPWHYKKRIPSPFDDNKKKTFSYLSLYLQIYYKYLSIQCIFFFTDILGVFIRKQNFYFFLWLSLRKGIAFWLENYYLLHNGTVFQCSIERKCWNLIEIGTLVIELGLR